MLQCRNCWNNLALNSIKIKTNKNKEMAPKIIKTNNKDEKNIAPLNKTNVFKTKKKKSAT